MPEHMQVVIESFSEVRRSHDPPVCGGAAKRPGRDLTRCGHHLQIGSCKPRGPRSPGWCQPGRFFRKDPQRDRENRPPSAG
jgi:hypothetical protein